MSGQRTILQSDVVTGRRCATCDFGRAETIRPDEHEIPIIECHRFPPARNKGWPQLLPEEWCGEHAYRDRFHPDIPAAKAGPGT